MAGTDKGNMREWVRKHEAEKLKEMRGNGGKEIRGRGNMERKGNLLNHFWGAHALALSDEVWRDRYNRLGNVHSALTINDLTSQQHRTNWTTDRL